MQDIRGRDNYSFLTPTFNQKRLEKKESTKK